MPKRTFLADDPSLPPSLSSCRRNLAYEIVLNQHMPTVESLTHSNLLIQHLDGNLKQIVEIYKQMGENVERLLPKG